LLITLSPFLICFIFLKIKISVNNSKYNFF
jgi:hypothetical protein